MGEVLKKAKAAREASLKLAKVPDRVRSYALMSVAKAIRNSKKKIWAANAEDLREAEALRQRGAVSKAFIQRLKLGEGKIDSIAEMVESVAKLKDPIGKTVYAMEMDKGLEVYKVTCPIGVIGSVFEARPDALPQISSLCLKSANAVILKGGSEAKHSNRTLHELIKKETETSGVPEGWIQLIEGREEVNELLKLDNQIDLLIPRGSSEFIKYIQANTHIPVLGHAEGICHVYVDEHADLKQAVEISYDAKVQYPAVCNAAETLLVHSKVAKEFLPKLASRYRAAKVEMRGDDRTRKILRGIKPAAERDWKTEYLDLIISVKVVDSLQEAIDHINTYGSKHTDAIVTSDRRAALEFMAGVDSSSVMVNASTRFSDGYRYGLGAEVGISTGKLHARGPMGLEGLTTTKYYVVGRGHRVADYTGPRARHFTHRPIRKKWSEAVN
ncbi:MAG: glutamate-5-semialdehyde dehydrogenase [Candidatus Hadarchaeota archaeon]